MSVRELVQRERALVRELGALSSQMERGGQGEADALLAILGERQVLLSEIQAIEDSLRGCELDDDLCREREEIAGAIEEVLAQDQRTLGVLLERRDGVLAELASMRRSRDAVRAYGGAGRGARYRDEQA